MNRPTLIILPGWGGTKESWKEFSHKAEEFFSVICLELPCFGDEPCPEEIWGVEDYVEFVNLKLKTFNSKVNLLGHSFGGQVAAYLAVEHPELVNKLILTGATVYRPKFSIKRALFKVVAKIGRLLFRLPLLNNLEDGARRILYKLAKSPDYIQTSGIKREIFKKVIREDVSPMLPKITVPTLVMWGSRDKYVPVKHGRKIAANILGAKLKIIKGGSHGLHLSRPRELLESIRHFI